MKFFLIGLQLMLSSYMLNAQNVFPNGFSNALNAVLKDYPNKFESIRGSITISNNGYTRYESWIKIPGSELCLIGDYTTSQEFSIFYLEKPSAKAEEDYLSFITKFKNVALIVSFEKSNEASASRNESYHPTSGGRDIYKKTTFICSSLDSKYNKLVIEVTLLTGEWPNAQMVVSINSGN